MTKLHRIGLITAWFCVLVFLLIFCAPGEPLWAYESKWDRVLEWGQAITTASDADRMFNKDSLLAVLYAEESGYPIYYVDQNATGNRSGSTWENAFKEIQPAIQKAAESEGWIWVAEGLYQESEWVTQAKSGSIYIRTGAMLFGGFAGHEQHLSERDPDLYPTVIQGFVGTGGGGLRAVFMEHKTLIDGFVITESGYRKNSSTGWGVSQAQDIAGGGIKTGSWLSIVRNNRILENHAKDGGGLSVFNRTTAQLYVNGYAPIIDRNYIYENHAVCGAGGHLRNSEVLFCNNIVFYNTHIPLPGETIKHKGVEIVMNLSGFDKPLLINNIIWGHSWRNLYYRLGDGYWSSSRNLYNCIQIPFDGWCEGLVDSDPLFTDPENGDFTLLQTSPCIDAGLPDGPLDPDGTRADIGIYNLRYRLTIDDGGSGADVLGAGVYFPYEIITISVDSTVTNQEGTARYRFVRWQGEGDGSYSGESRTATVQMNSDITQTIIWLKEFWLEVDADHDIDNLSGWYDEGDIVPMTVPSHIEAGSGERREFISWSGEGVGSVTGTDTSISVTMNSPVRQTVNWDIEYFLTLVSAYGAPEGEGWHDAGSEITIRVTTPDEGAEGIQYIFTGWQGMGDGSYTGSDPSPTVVMNQPITETAGWKTQYYLTVITERGSTTGEGWHDANSVVTLTTDTVETLTEESRYHFQEWQGTGPGAYSGENDNPSFTMIGPVTETAIWKQEYWIDITLDPPGGGDVVPISEGGGWWVHDQILNLTAVANADSGFGFTGWSGDTTSYANPLQLMLNRPIDLTARFEMGDVIVQTDPAGLNFIADGDTFSAPRTFFWQPQENHQLSVITPQDGDPQVRYIFHRWQDYNGNQREIVIPEEPIVFTAIFKAEYFLQIQSDYGPETALGEGWYNRGDTVFVSIDSLVQSTGDMRQKFIEWIGTGDGSLNSTDREITVIVDGPIIQTALWLPQYSLDVTVSPPYGGHVELNPPDNWYDVDDMVQMEAVPRDTNFSFESWSGDISIDQNPISIQMNAPKNIMAHFSTSSIFPPDISSIPDTSIFEDNVLSFSFDDMSKFVFDLNDPIDSLVFSLKEGSHFSLEIDHENNQFLLIPSIHWHGQENLIIEVSDPWALSDTDTFEIVVMAVPDPPEPFGLLWPENNITIPDSIDFVDFCWEASENVDIGDVITYEFFLGADSTFLSGGTLRIFVQADTTLLLNRAQINGMAYWAVNARDQDGLSRLSETRRISYFSSVDETARIPETFHLAQNFPNPFNADTQIPFDIPERGHVSICIYDVQGRMVCHLMDQEINPGQHSIAWHGKDDLGEDLSTGPYFVRIQFKSSYLQNKMLYIR